MIEFCKRHYLGLIGISLMIIGIFMTYMYVEGGRGIECENQIKEWLKEHNNISAIDKSSGNELMTILTSDVCEGMIDIEKTKEMNPGLFQQLEGIEVVTNPEIFKEIKINKVIVK